MPIDDGSTVSLATRTGERGTRGTGGTVRVVPLGGLGEVGMNCLALEQRGEALIVDCGVTFDDRGLGIDVVHPDFSALEGYRIAGLFITHGHEDHIGAIPYFLRRFDVPVFGPPYALGLVRDRVGEHPLLEHARLREVAPRERVRVGSFEVEPIRVTHSIADATALAIATDAGLVIHSGDFKFDAAPPDGEPFDVARFEELGTQGVRLLLSDSTNVDAQGPTGSEESVAEALDAIVAGAQAAVVVGVFASNVHRLRILGEIARRRGRKIVTLGRSVARHARVARAVRRSSGGGAPYLEWPSDLVWPPERLAELPRSHILAIATGTQGEEPAALARLARGEHPALELQARDVVVFSSRVIPGHEAAVSAIVDGLLRRGVEVRTRLSDRKVHVSGHAHRDEQRRLIELVRPRGFVPVHGTLHHLSRHAALAAEVGVPEPCVLEDGDEAEVSADGIRKVGRVAAGRVHLFAGREVPARVLRERVALAARGVAQLVVPVDARGRRAGEIALAVRGVVDVLDGERQIESARQAVAQALDDLAGVSPEDRFDDAAVEAVARQAVRRSFAAAVGFKPMTSVIVLRVRP